MLLNAKALVVVLLCAIAIFALADAGKPRAAMLEDEVRPLDEPRPPLPGVVGVARQAELVRRAIEVGDAEPAVRDRVARFAERLDRLRAALEARQPSGRLVPPADIAAAISYLAGPSAGSVTGTALAVDGGIQELRLRR